MKQILPTFVTVCAMACCGRSAVSEDKLGFIDDIYEISLNYPDSALTILDRGRAEGLISDDNYRCCHASVLYNQAEYAAAASEYEELLGMIGEDEKSAGIRMEALKHLSYIRAFSGDYESAVRMEGAGQSGFCVRPHFFGEERRRLFHIWLRRRVFFNRKEISGICAEEHMIPQLVESLRWDDFRSEECLESLKQYSGLLDGKQREGLVTSYVENLRMDAVEVNSSHYGRIRYSMELLRDSCPEGAAAVESLASEFCESYHRRPAFMREMRRLMSSSYTT